MPQQTKTEALEELVRLIRRDIMNGTARLNETWWFDNDTKMQDRIAHVLLDYSDEEKPTELSKVSYNSRLDVFCAQIDELTEKCAALVVERDFYKGAVPSMLQAAAPSSAPYTTGGLVETPAVEVEEQGPWVVMAFRNHGLPMARCQPEGLQGTIRSSEIDKAMVFRKKSDAERQCVDKDERVITLAEARALEAKAKR